MNDSAPLATGRLTRLLGSAAELARAETVESAVAGALDIARTALDQPLVGIYEYDPATESVSVVDASSELDEDDVPDRPTESIVERLDEREEGISTGSHPEASIATDTEGPLAAEVLVPAGRRWVLRLGATTPDGLDETDVTVAEQLAGLLGAALTRIDGRQRVTTAEVTRSLFEQSTDATFISDGDGTVVAANDAAAALAGRDRAALSGTALTDVLIENAPQDAVATGDRGSGTLQRPDGTAVAVELEHRQVAVAGTNYVRTTARKRDRTDVDGDEQGGPDAASTDAETIRRLYGLTVGSDDFDETVEQLLSLGREHFGLDTGILARIEGTEYEVEAVVDSTGTYEPGATFDLGETLCQVTLEPSESTPLAFADVADTEHREHPASSAIRAYIAAPVVVDGETYGTVNFSMQEARDTPFRPGEREFVELVAQWVGVEIERRRRLEELERYETILEAVDDPVYALDAEGNFTFVNEAAKREFGYGTELIGESPSVGMQASAVSRVRDGIEELLATDQRSMVAEFDIETADGTRRTVENRLGRIGDDEFRGTAGVVRDITEREERRRKLERFQRAVEEAADGIAVLDGDEYTYVDQSHVDMYGFESKEQLLGSTWRELYDDAEIERLEAEAFPALESEGYWRGMVTGSRPDGSTFPAELSLTIVEDGRLVCTVRDETERRERERELELKERAMDEAEVGIQITDPTQPDNPLVYVNDGFARITGYSREAVLGRNPRFLQGEETNPERTARLRAAFDGEKPVSVELRNYRKDGTPYWARLSITPVTDESGAVQNYIGIQQDVTDRRERSQWLQQFLNRGPLMFIETRQVDGEAVVDSCNQRFVERLGYDRDEIEGQPLAALYTADSAADLQEGGYEEALAGTFEMNERTLVDADGDHVHTLLRAVPRRDETTGTNALFIDISEREARERALEESQERYRTLLRAAPDPVFVADAESGEIIESNTAAAEALGRPRDEIIGCGQTDLHPEGDDDLYRAAFERAIGSSTMISELPDGTQPKLRSADGEPVPIEINADTVELPQGPVVYGVFRDISERKAREESLRASEQRYRRLADNIPNGAVITFDADLECQLAAGELLSELGLDASDMTGRAVGTLLDDGGGELLARFRAALEGERTDRRVELGGRTLRLHIVPIHQAGADRAHASGLVLAQDVTEEARREQELYEERERFRLLTESVDEYAFLVVDADGAVRTWNGSAEAMFGYDAETAVGMPMADLHPEDERESGLPARLLQQARVAGESAHEGWHVRADGSEFYADVRYAPLESEDGTFRGYAMIVRDMTDRRRQQRRTETFVKESEDVVAIVDTDGNITYASGSAERVFGYDPDDLVGHNLFDYLHPDGRADAMETFFNGIEDPDADLETECRLESADGEWRNVEGLCRNKLDDDAIDGMLLYLRDVTDRKSQARRFESIFNQTFQFTGLVKPDGTVVEVNDATLEFASIQRHELVGGSLPEAPWWAHSEAAAERARDALERAADGEFVRYETEARGVDGLATIDFSIKPVTDEDGAVTLLVVEGRDITRIKQHRRHLGVMQRVMRHNMRNDLMKMRGWAEAMYEESDAEKRAEHFEIIEGILDKWTSMTRKMKEIREVMQSRSEGQRSGKPISAALEAAVAASRAAYPEATIDIDAACDDAVSIPPSLVDAVSELIENAAEACDASTIVVESSRPERDWLEVTVRDDGPGMPEMEADVLQTGEESPLNHGQGLGLWMVRMIVTQAGGEVTVETGEDGTAVILRLPAEPVDSTGRSGTIAR